MLDLSVLNEAQKRAVMHPGGPAMVLAGPGSGKTFLIVNRIRYLIEHQKVSPDAILVITFTKAAALSMERRFMESTGGQYPEVWFGTFHSFFFYLLKTYSLYHNDSLITQKEKIHYLKEIFAEMNLLWDESAHFEELLKENHGQNWEVQNCPEGMSAETVNEIKKRFAEKMFQDKKLDFDDMAVLCHDLLQKNQALLQSLREKYKYILIDEYQDINEPQERVVRLLAAPCNEIMVVGDDDQSIYGFRGSVPEIMKNFPLQYPETKTYYLEQNYRSKAQIVETSVAVIAENKNRFLKKLYAKEEGGEVHCLGFREKGQEYEYIKKRITELAKTGSLSDMAVIARSNRDLEPIYLFLQKAGIPCLRREKGISIFEHFVVKDLLGCIAFSIGKRERAPESWRKMGGNENLRKILAAQTPFTAIHFLCKKVGYEKYLRSQAIKLKEQTAQDEKLNEWQELIIVLKEHAKNYKSLSIWLEEVEEYVRMQQEKKKNEGLEQDEAAVNLMTLHAAKGLEFSYVCLPDVNEGNIPGKQCRSKEEIEEERRILYVGMTRAKKALDILYLTGTLEYPRLPSRFLNPILKRENESYSASSTSSSNSTLSKNSSKASATASYSSSSSI
ncbi:MAG: ATP-dependent helicase [Lachnospiraceae bacterium]|nr:ATP-dependent helicase [Lachnospiraceae bacterium]